MTVDNAPGLTRRRRIVVEVGAVLVLVAVIVGGYRWTHPTVLSSGDTGSIEVIPQPISAFPAYIGFAMSHQGAPETITLQGAKVTLDNNTARFTAELNICTERPAKEGSLKLGSGSDMSDEDLTELCSDLRPVRDGITMRIAEKATEYLIVTLTPKHAGTGHFGHVDITYSRNGRHLFQRGTQRLTENVKLTVR